MMLAGDIVLVETTLDDENNRLDDEWWITIEGMGLRISRSDKIKPSNRVYIWRKKQSI